MTRPESPLAMLAAWHRLGESRFDTLRWLLERLPAPATDLPVRDAAHAVLIYFDRSAAVHHRDEEDDLFPALVESLAGSDPVCVRELAAAAAAGHRAIESAWRVLRPSIDALSRGAAATLDAAAVARLVRQCRDNFRLEDRELLPMAERLLDDATLARLRERISARHA
jgi:hemerythrin-like domain-containing protein